MSKPCQATCRTHQGEVTTVMVNSGLRHWEQADLCVNARHVEADNGFKTVKIEEFVKYIEQRFAIRTSHMLNEYENKHYELSQASTTGYSKDYHENVSYGYGRANSLMMRLADLGLDPTEGLKELVADHPPLG